MYGYGYINSLGLIGGGVSVDPDAQAFITAASITDPTQQSAVNQLVIDLKATSIWTKMKAVYPFIGGSASSHKWNLKDPRDLDAAYRLIFAGGWTHSNTGALPNGTNGWANTKLPPTDLSLNSGHLSYYSRTDSAFANEIPMGILSGDSGGDGFNLVIRRDTNLNSFRSTESGGAAGLVNSTSTDSRGLTTGSITSATSRKLYKNGSLLNTNSSNITWSRNTLGNIVLGAAYDTFAVNILYYTNKECAFASIGDGLTDTDVSNLYTAVQTFQTSLSRQVP